MFAAAERLIAQRIDAGRENNPSTEEQMKKFALALAAVLGLAFVVPAAAPAQAETKKIIIKRGHDRGHHMGWRNHRGGNKKVVIIKKRSHHM